MRTEERILPRGYECRTLTHAQIVTQLASAVLVITVYIAVPYFQMLGIPGAEKVPKGLAETLRTLEDEEHR